jgi:MFS family permease
MTHPQATKQSVSVNGQFSWYLGGLSTWWISVGLQMVLVPFLVANVLGESPGRLGIAQMVMVSPALFFMLLAGTLADKIDPRIVLLRIHVLAVIPSLGMAFLVGTDRVTFYAVLGYAFMMGSLGSFHLPSRESQLNGVVGRSRLQRAVSVTTAVQFLSQVFGFVVSGMASLLGTFSLFLFQGLVMLLGTWASWRVLPQKKMVPDDIASVWTRLREGFEVVIQYPAMRTASLMSLMTGFLFMSTLLVTVPLINRDIYQGDSTSLAQLMVGFFGGLIFASIALGWIRSIVYVGRPLAIFLALGACILMLGTISVPFWVFFLIVFCWGGCTGVFFTLGRAIMQQTGPESHRARAISIFQLGLMGGGPPAGSLLMGFLAGILGPVQVIYVAGMGMLAVVLVALIGGIWQLDLGES